MDGTGRTIGDLTVKTDEGTNIDLYAMTKAQLIEYATTNGIEVKSSMTKAQIIETIEG